MKTKETGSKILKSRRPQKLTENQQDLRDVALRSGSDIQYKGQKFKLLNTQSTFLYNIDERVLLVRYILKSHFILIITIVQSVLLRSSFSLGTCIT